MLGITAGFHRLFSHRSYAAHPALRAALAVIGTMAGQGTVLVWAATHRKHHQYTEKPEDPHSPYLEGVPAWKAFWHAHVGWILNFFPTDWERYIPDLLQDPLLVALHKRSMLVVFAGLLLPGIVGGLLTASWGGFWSGMLWGGWVRVFLVEQSVCLVNSAAHVWGRRPFETRDHSTNNWPVAILSLGEGWHNGHHAFPASVHHGLNRFELDPTYVLIRLFALVGLADRLVLPERQQIEAKRLPPKAC
jgi:stearoyl-CoA desaturase (delta-9 desaturase)